MKVLLWRILFPVALATFCIIYVSVRLVWGEEEADRITDHLLTKYEDKFE